MHNTMSNNYYLTLLVLLTGIINTSNVNIFPINSWVFILFEFGIIAKLLSVICHPREWRTGCSDNFEKSFGKTLLLLSIACNL